MNILVTGSAGLIGGQIVDTFKKNYNVFRLDTKEKNPVFRCDLAFPEEVVDYAERVLLINHPDQRIKIDLVIHMAGMWGNEKCLSAPDVAWESNILAFNGVTGLTRLAKCKTLVFPINLESFLDDRKDDFCSAMDKVILDTAVAVTLGYGIKCFGLKTNFNKGGFRSFEGLRSLIDSLGLGHDSVDLH